MRCRHDCFRQIYTIGRLFDYFLLAMIGYNSFLQSFPGDKSSWRPLGGTQLRFRADLTESISLCSQNLPIYTRCLCRRAFLHDTCLAIIYSNFHTEQYKYNENRYCHALKLFWSVGKRQLKTPSYSVAGLAAMTAFQIPCDHSYPRQI